MFFKCELRVQAAIRLNTVMSVPFQSRFEASHPYLFKIISFLMYRTGELFIIKHQTMFTNVHK